MDKALLVHAYMHTPLHQARASHVHNKDKPTGPITTKLRIEMNRQLKVSMLSSLFRLLSHVLRGIAALEATLVISLQKEPSAYGLLAAQCSTAIQNALTGFGTGCELL